VSSRSHRIALTRGDLDTDGDCVPDANEIGSGTDPRNPNDPHTTPPPQPVECCDADSFLTDWYWDVQTVPGLETREGGLSWLRVDWSFQQIDANYACVSRLFVPPVRMEPCRKIKADIQALEAQRVKVELKTRDAQAQTEWVRTETFVFEAGEFQTIVVEAPKLWGDTLAETGGFDLYELTFTIDRRHDNPVSGTYWVRNIQLVGRPCASSGSCSH
jgi:hypothetical protein